MPMPEFILYQSIRNIDPRMPSAKDLQNRLTQALSLRSADSELPHEVDEWMSMTLFNTDTALRRTASDILTKTIKPQLKEQFNQAKDKLVKHCLTTLKSEVPFGEIDLKDVKNAFGNVFKKRKLERLGESFKPLFYEAQTEIFKGYLEPSGNGTFKLSKKSISALEGAAIETVSGAFGISEAALRETYHTFQGLSRGTLDSFNSKGKLPINIGSQLREAVESSKNWFSNNQGGLSLPKEIQASLPHMQAGADLISALGQATGSKELSQIGSVASTGLQLAGAYMSGGPVGFGMAAISMFGGFGSHKGFSSNMNSSSPESLIIVQLSLIQKKLKKIDKRLKTISKSLKHIDKKIDKIERTQHVLLEQMVEGFKHVLCEIQRTKCSIISSQAAYYEKIYAAISRHTTEIRKFIGFSIEINLWNRILPILDTKDSSGYFKAYKKSKFENTWKEKLLPVIEKFSQNSVLTGTYLLPFSSPHTGKGNHAKDIKQDIRNRDIHDIFGFIVNYTYLKVYNPKTFQEEYGKHPVFQPIIWLAFVEAYIKFHTILTRHHNVRTIQEVREDIRKMNKQIKNFEFINGRLTTPMTLGLSLENYKHYLRDQVLPEIVKERKHEVNQLSKSIMKRTHVPLPFWIDLDARGKSLKAMINRLYKYASFRNTPMVEPMGEKKHAGKIDNVPENLKETVTYFLYRPSGSINLDRRSRTINLEAVIPIDINYLNYRYHVGSVRSSTSPHIFKLCKLCDMFSLGRVYLGHNITEDKREKKSYTFYGRYKGITTFSIGTYSIRVPLKFDFYKKDKKVCERETTIYSSEIKVYFHEPKRANYRISNPTHGVKTNKHCLRDYNTFTKQDEKRAFQALEDHLYDRRKDVVNRLLKTGSSFKSKLEELDARRIMLLLYLETIGIRKADREKMATYLPDSGQIINLLKKVRNNQYIFQDVLKELELDGKKLHAKYEALVYNPVKRKGVKVLDNQVLQQVRAAKAQLEALPGYLEYVAFGISRKPMLSTLNTSGTMFSTKKKGDSQAKQSSSDYEPMKARL